MKDRLGHEIKEGHLIFKTNTSVIGVATGGHTSGGKVRFINHYGIKDNADTHNIVIITEEQALPMLDKIKFVAEEELALANDNKGNSWYVDMLNKKINAKEQLLTLHRETAPQRI